MNSPTDSTPEVTKLQEFSKFSNPTQTSAEDYGSGKSLVEKEHGKSEKEQKDPSIRTACWFGFKSLLEK